MKELNSGTFESGMQFICWIDENKYYVRIGMVTIEFIIEQDFLDYVRSLEDSVIKLLDDRMLKKGN